MLSFVKTVSEKLLAVLFLILILTIPFSVHADESQEEQGIVTAKFLNVRDKPDRDAGVLKTLEKDDVVRIVRRTGNGWLEIEAGGENGYIRDRNRYVRVFQVKSKTKIKHEAAEEVQKPQADEEAAVQAQKSKANVEREIEEHTREIKEIDSKIKQHKQKVKEYSEKETVIIQGLYDIDRTLNLSRQKLLSIKTALDHLETEIRTNTSAIDDLNQVIATNEVYIGKRLVALYKLNQVGRLNILASSDSVYDLLKRRQAMEFVLNADDKVLTDHLRNMNRLTELKIRLSEQKRNDLALQDDYNRQIGIIEKNKEKKKALLGEIREKKSVGLAAIDSLKEAAEELNQTLRALDQGFDRSTQGPVNPERYFVEKKGLLKMPVNGKIISLFGTSTDNEFNVETFHTGIKIRAERGDPVQAVAEGRVLFSNWLKGFGNLIIIDHGNNYYSLYGHTEEVFKKKGDRVEEREVVATVGDTGSLTGPALHFEIRHRGEPLNPEDWLSKK